MLVEYPTNSQDSAFQTSIEGFALAAEFTKETIDCSKASVVGLGLSGLVLAGCAAPMSEAVPLTPPDITIGSLEVIGEEVFIEGEVETVVNSMSEVSAQNSIDTCVVDNPDGSKSLFDVTGIQPGGEKALGETVTCYKHDPNKPRFAVNESPISGERGVIDVSGLTRQEAEMILDPTGGYIR